MNNNNASGQNNYQKLLVRSKFKILALLINIQLGSINFGYVLSYLTLSIDTLFKHLDIINEDENYYLSLINGILPLGCVFGVLVGYFIQKKLTYKQSIIFSDLLGLTSLLTLIADVKIIIIFRFILGIANGLSSLTMPVYMKSMCPEQYFVQMSLVTGYGLNTGLMIGQLMGLGYLRNFSINPNLWWRIVFSVPAIIAAIRLFFTITLFNYDSPEQLIYRKRINDAKKSINYIYKEEYQNLALERYRQVASTLGHPHQKFIHIFSKSKFITLQIGLISMLAQIWCGAFAVFQYSAQIFEQLSNGDLYLKTEYTICIGVFAFLSQFLTIYFIKLLGPKYLMICGSILLGGVNIVIGMLMLMGGRDSLFGVFLLFVFMIMVFAASIGPVAWSIVPQLNDDDATFFVMGWRWAIQAILIFCFPYMIEEMDIFGCFILFGFVNLCFTCYTIVFIIDSRGMSHQQLMLQYKTKYKVFSPINDEEYMK